MTARAEPYRFAPPAASVGANTAFRSAIIAIFAALALCTLVGLYASSNTPTAVDRIVVAGLFAITGVIVAISSPSHLVDVFLVGVVTNRLIRRLLDWGEGRFDQTPLLSLVPMALCGLMFMVMITRWSRLPRSTQQGAVLIFLGLGYGLAIGVGTRMAALYAAGEYLMPLIVCLFCTTCRPDARTMTRWVAVLLGLSVLVSLYGIVQWILVPPWDARWLIWSGMYTSMGSAEPFKLSIASTLESRGPASWFFATTAAIAVASPAMRGRGGIIAAALASFALLLTRARAGLVFMLLSVIVAATLQGRRGGFKLILALCVLAAITGAVITSFEKASPLAERVATLGSLRSDGSTNVRAEIAREGIKTVIQHPMGFGLGSGGNGARALNSGQSSAIGDNGYLEIASTLGLPGMLLFAMGIFFLFRPLMIRIGSAPEDSFAIIGKALALSTLPALMVGNCIIGSHATYIGILISGFLGALGAKKRSHSAKQQR